MTAACALRKLTFFSNLIRAGLLSLTAFAPFVGHAGDIVRANLYTSPNRIFVGQSFVIHFDVETTAGTELNDLQITGLPNDPDLIALGSFENVSQNRITRGSQDLTAFHYTATARCYKPIAQTFSPVLQCLLVERRSIGFFTQMQSFSKRINIEPLALHVLPLPVDGRPAAFSGAVGQFKLTGTLSADRVHPGDIITLSLDLSGQGWLGNVAMPEPPTSHNFKVYPPKETLHEPLHLKTDQVFIPASTNATEIATVRFNFFNPSTGHYEETTSGPFALTFTDKASPKAEEVRVINTGDTTAPFSSGSSLIVKRSDLTFRQMLPLISLCTAGVVGLWIFFMLLGRHTRAAFLVATCVFALGFAASLRLGNKKNTDVQKIGYSTEARFAPSQASPALFSLNPGTPATPLETAGQWTRVDAEGRRGWIPSSALSDAPKSTSKAPVKP